MKIVDRMVALFFLIALVSFNVIEAGWSSPKILNQVDSRTLKIRLDATGHATAIWEMFDGKDTNIQTARLPKGGQWTDPITISSHAGDHFSFPALAVNPSGQAVAVWQEWTGTLFTIKSSTLNKDGTWSQPISVSEPNGSSHDPSITIDLSGRATAIWVKGELSGVIQSSILPFQGKWSSPTNLSDSKLQALEPRIAVNSNGKTVAVWRIKDLEVIESSTLLTNGWSSPAIISEDLNGVNSEKIMVGLPRIAVDNQENAVAVWAEKLQNPAGIVIKSSICLSSEGAWTKPIPITDTLLQALSSSLSFAMDAQGNGLLLWGCDEDPLSYIQGAAYHHERSWSKPIEIASRSDLENEDITVALAVSANGISIAAWDWGGALQASTLLSEGKWSSPVTFSGKDPKVKDVAIDPTGYAVMSWTAGGVTVYSVWTPFAHDKNLIESSPQ